MFSIDVGPKIVIVPKYPFINFWDPKGKYFLTLSHSCNINYDFEKIFLNNFSHDLSKV